MKTLKIALLFLAFIFNQAAYALCTPTGPTIATAGTFVDINSLCTALNTGAAVEMAITLQETQDTSLLKQAAQLAQEIETTQNLIIHTEMMIKDLEENPLEVVVPDINQILVNQERINKLANEIDANSSKVGQNLMKDLSNPKSVGLGHGSKFQLWSEARRKNVEESYAKVVQFVKDAKAENEVTQKEAKNAAGLTDKTQAAKTSARIAGHQLATENKMLEVLNQLLGASATRDGNMLREEATAQALTDEYIHSGGITVEPDTYQWQRKTKNSAF